MFNSFRHSQIQIRRWRKYLLLLFLLFPVASVMGQTAPSLPLELKQMKAATGGENWDSVVLLKAEGEKKSFGLDGKFHLVEDLTTGFYSARADYGLFANGEGQDHSGRWREDNSGEVHPLNSAEAAEVAVSESYLERRGYFFPDRTPATFGVLTQVTEGAKSFIRIIATPTQGRPLTLWIDKATSLLDRASMDLSIGTRVIRYGDYRPVGLLKLPFAIIVEHGDENESGVATINAYEIETEVGEHSVVRPTLPTRDVTIANNSRTSTTKGYLDGSTGFFIVDASINGKGPYPFILDTGGHNILTPQMVRQLGLTAIGKGFSTGAGSGTTSTEFTKVKSIAIGSAVISEQPFTVLHIDLGMAHQGRRQVAIAGILGLELFERFAITTDYKAQTVTLEPLANFSYRGRGIGVPISFTSDMPIAAAKLDGHLASFGVDTGNNLDLIVAQAWATANGLAPGDKKLDSTSVGGQLELTKAQANSFVIGGVELGPLDILIAPEHSGSLSSRSEAGNFGNAILRRFTVTFDYRAGLMYLEP